MTQGRCRSHWQEQKGLKVSVERGELQGMPTPRPPKSYATALWTDQITAQTRGQARPEEGQETERCLDSFLGILEYLSEATGLSIEDIADLLSSKEGPIGAMVIAGHLQTTARTQQGGGESI